MPRLVPTTKLRGTFPEVSPFARSLFRIAGLATLLVTVAAAPAAATWSIVGVDSESGDVGVAIASCVPSFALGDPVELMALVPGVGAGVSQADANRDVPGVMAQHLAEGDSALQIITAVTDPVFDDRANDRQHAVVRLDGGEASAFTGSATLAVALDRQATGVSAQGNILVSEAVVEDSIAAFEATEGDLTARLVAALSAGSAAGGDSRCPGQTALFATVAVASSGDAPETPTVRLHYAVESGSDQNPIQLLVAAHAAGVRQADETPSITSELGGLLLVLGIGLVGIVGFFALVWTRRKAKTLT